MMEKEQLAKYIIATPYQEDVSIIWCQIITERLVGWVKLYKYPKDTENEKVCNDDETIPTKEDHYGNGWNRW